MKQTLNKKHSFSASRATKNISASYSLPTIAVWQEWPHWPGNSFVWGNFLNAEYSLKQVSVQVSFNIIVCYDEFQDISDLKTFPEWFRRHSKRCCEPHVACGQLFAHPCSIVHRMSAKDGSEWRWAFFFNCVRNWLLLRVICGTNRWIHFSDHTRPVTYSINLKWKSGHTTSSLPFR